MVVVRIISPVTTVQLPYHGAIVSEWAEEATLPIDEVRSSGWARTVVRLVPADHQYG